MRSLIGTALVVFGIAFSATAGDPIKVVAAENVYGDIAGQIGGGNVAVTSILSNPNQDPHEFEASAATARAIAEAKFVIYNGADYDPWVAKLLAASKSQSRLAIEVAKLIHKKAGDNPHLWYHPAAAEALASAFAPQLARADPAHQQDFVDRLARFQASTTVLHDKIAALRKKYAGTPVTATEPLFDYMAEALGFEMRSGGFQLAVMNGTEPSAAAVAAFERDLRTKAVKLLLYNTQTSQALAERMRAIAVEVGVPVVAITETEPVGQRYQEWMLSQLEAIERALGGR